MAGFTRAKEAWLPVDARQRLLAVDKQERLAESMLHTTRRLIALRKSHQALSSGGFQLIEASDGILVFERDDGDERVRCLFNFSEHQVSLDLPGKRDILWTYEAVVSGKTATMSGFSAAWIRMI